jgi:hypothetical protein
MWSLHIRGRWYNDFGVWGKCIMWSYKILRSFTIWIFFFVKHVFSIKEIVKEDVSKSADILNNTKICVCYRTLLYLKRISQFRWKLSVIINLNAFCKNHICSITYFPQYRLSFHEPNHHKNTLCPVLVQNFWTDQARFCALFCWYNFTTEMQLLSTVSWSLNFTDIFLFLTLSTTSLIWSSVHCPRFYCSGLAVVCSNSK